MNEALTYSILNSLVFENFSNFRQKIDAEVTSDAFLLSVWNNIRNIQIGKSIWNAFRQILSWGENQNQAKHER